MSSQKLVITTINIDAFTATGHVLPSSYIIDLSEEQVKLLKKIKSRGETVDHVLLSEDETIKPNK